jgi:tetratricopeptide (TPR) repeat protein
VSEEQRRYIVQANVLSQEKDYGKAIELYLKAVELDSVSYPAAYFNLALLSAQMNRFTSAISCMKQYLLLEPGAQDARSAQDKIYEWELRAGK